MYGADKTKIKYTHIPKIQIFKSEYRSKNQKTSPKCFDVNITPQPLKFPPFILLNIMKLSKKKVRNKKNFCKNF